MERPSKEQHDKIVKDIQATASFAVPFAKAIVKLRDASNRGVAVRLEPDEVNATIEAFRMLKRPKP